MRSTTLLMAAFLSFPAVACPHLAGLYQGCHSSTGQKSLTQSLKVEQKMVNKIHQFTITTKEDESDEIRVENYKADGKIRSVTDTDPDTGIRIQTDTSARCSGNQLYVKMHATVESETFAEVEVKIFKNNQQLVQVYSGTSMGEPIDDTIICEAN